MKPVGRVRQTEGALWSKNGRWGIFRPQSLYFRYKANMDEKFRPLYLLLMLTFKFCYDQTLVTLPERRQREHTWRVLWVPLTSALTVLMLGFHCLFVLRLEWETLSPNVTPFPQISHFAIFCTSILYTYNYYFEWMMTFEKSTYGLYHNTFKNARGFLKKQKKIQKNF